VQELAVATATNSPVTAANVVATENLRIYVFGNFAVNVGGTLIPQFQYSAAPGGVPTVKRGSFFTLWLIGAGNLVNIN
jgi:microcystin degradation protein MlrC